MYNNRKNSSYIKDLKGTDKMAVIKLVNVTYMGAFLMAYYYNNMPEEFQKNLRMTDCVLFQIGGHKYNESASS